MPTMLVDLGMVWSVRLRYGTKFENAKQLRAPCLDGGAEQLHPVQQLCGRLSPQDHLAGGSEHEHGGYSLLNLQGAVLGFGPELQLAVSQGHGVVWDPGGALDHAHRVLEGARRGGLGPGHRAGSAWQGSSLDGCAH